MTKTKTILAALGVTTALTAPALLAPLFTAPSAVAAAPTAAPAVAGVQDFSELAAKVTPAVVNVAVSTKVGAEDEIGKVVALHQLVDGNLGGTLFALGERRNRRGRQRQSREGGSGHQGLAAIKPAHCVHPLHSILSWVPAIALAQALCFRVWLITWARCAIKANPR